MTIGIDQGQQLAYNANFPISGINQNSQPFRDNNAIIKTAIENLQTKTITALGVMSGTSGIVDSGTGTIIFNTAFSNGVIVVPTGVPSSPTVGSLHFNPNTDNLEVFVNSQWIPITPGVTLQSNGTAVASNIGTLNFIGGNLTVSNGVASITAGASAPQVQSIVGGMFTTGTQTGLNANYNSTAGTINLTANTFTITLTGSVTGSAAVNSLGNVNIPTSGGGNATIENQGTTIGTQPTINISTGQQIIITTVNNLSNSRIDVTVYALAEAWFLASSYSCGAITSNQGQILNMGGLSEIINVQAQMGAVIPIISPADQRQFAMYLYGGLINATS
jgi:hypothetical protein